VILVSQPSEAVPRGGVYPGWLHQLIATDPTTTAAPGEHVPDAAVYPTKPKPLAGRPTYPAPATRPPPLRCGPHPPPCLREGIPDLPDVNVASQRSARPMVSLSVCSACWCPRCLEQFEEFGRRDTSLPQD
jgi:hypothetical protein